MLPSLIQSLGTRNREMSPPGTRQTKAELPQSQDSRTFI